MADRLENQKPRFIADENVGKLARLLRILGFNTVLFGGGDDSVIVENALVEKRIILTRDTHIQERRPVQHGKVRVVLLRDDDPETQIRKVIRDLKLEREIRPFTICIEDNTPLEKREKAELQDRIPPYVWQTQQEFLECPACRRIYWKGTHWTAMTDTLRRILQKSGEQADEQK